MPWSASSRSVAVLHFSGSPTTTGTMCVSFGMTGNPAALSTALTRAAILMAFALEARGLQMPDGSRCCGADRGWKRGGEDEAGCVAAYRVAEHRARRAIAPETAERL